MGKIEDLRPKTQQLCRMWLKECEKLGIKIKILMVLRTIEQQDALYSQGRESLGAVNAKMKKAGLWSVSEKENKYTVTKAKGGQSAHNYGLAWDFDAEIEGLTKNQAMIKAGLLAETLSLDGYTLIWGGDWDKDGDYKDEKFLDMPHIQLQNWKNYI